MFHSLHFVVAVAATVAHHARHNNPIVLALAGCAGGFAVGVTGMGGGALMTPALVLLFGIDPKVAVASDLVNSLVMKPVGAAVHAQRRTVQWVLVGWLVVGSVPAGFAGAYVVNQFDKAQKNDVKLLLG